MQNHGDRAGTQMRTKPIVKLGAQGADVIGITAASLSE